MSAPRQQLLRTVVGTTCNFAPEHWRQLPGPYNGEALVFSSVLCPDLKTLVGMQQGNKIMAALDLAVTLIPYLDIAKAGEVLTKFGLELPALAAKFGPAAAKILGCALCFPAGTMVATPQGRV